MEQTIQDVQQWESQQETKKQLLCRHSVSQEHKIAPITEQTTCKGAQPLASHTPMTQGEPCSLPQGQMEKGGRQYASDDGHSHHKRVPKKQARAKVMDRRAKLLQKDLQTPDQQKEWILINKLQGIIHSRP